MAEQSHNESHLPSEKFGSIFDLEYHVFVYRGRSVPGKTLAELLGMAGAEETPLQNTSYARSARDE